MEESIGRRELIQKFIRTDRLHHNVLEKQIAFSGLHRSQHLLLLHLSQSGGTSTQKELAEHFQISPAAVAVTLKKLEEGGYITRLSSDSDKRCRAIRLTAKGQETLDKTKKLVDAADEAMFADFSAEEMARLSGYLDKMQRNLIQQEEEKS